MRVAEIKIDETVRKAEQENPELMNDKLPVDD